MKTRKRLVLYTFLTLILLVITGCMPLDSTTPLIPTATALPTNPAPTLLPATITPTSTSVFPTPEITPRATTIIDIPEQVTDGKLKLSITETLKDTCYQPGSRIPLLLVYENMTDDALKIVDYNIISSHVILGAYGRLIPRIATIQNIRLYSIEDSMLVELFNPNPPLVQVLPARTKFEVEVEYYLSTDFVAAGQREGRFLPTPNGNYFLKFVYRADGYEGAWSGDISSNRIEICVSN